MKEPSGSKDSTVGVLLVGLPVWALIFIAFRFALPEGGVHVPLTGFFGTTPQLADDFIQQVLRVSAGPGLLLTLVMTALAALVLTFTVLPSVWNEVRAPSRAPIRGRSGSGAASSRAATRLEACTAAPRSRRILRRRARPRRTQKDSAALERCGGWQEARRQTTLMLT